VTGYRDMRWAPHGVQVRNPAFDVTPAELISGLITEVGVVLQPNAAKIRKLLK
jgi:methylthioribose-1-phosphate isomerase